MEAQHHTDPYEGKTLLDRYEVRRRLGAGGTATVYLAIQQPIGREVAIKILRADLAGPERGALADRLVREAQLIARLSHPHIVSVYDCGKLPNEAVYVVMECIKGEPLTAQLVGPLEAERAVRITLGLAEALRHAHLNGVIHRDLKPSNVLMTKADDGKEVPKLVDFGIGKGINDTDETTVVGRFLGTPQYASPEQAMGLAEVDGRTDIYALGCLMYRMLAGVLPFEADTAMGVAFKQVHAPWPPMASRSAAMVDSALEAIVQRCMEKKPEDRWPDAEALIGALRAWQQRELSPVGLSRPVPPLALRSMETPISIANAAVLPPPLTVVEPKRSRWPLIAGIMGLIGILFAGGIGIAGWQFFVHGGSPAIGADPAVEAVVVEGKGGDPAASPALPAAGVEGGGGSDLASLPAPAGSGAEASAVGGGGSDPASPVAPAGADGVGGTGTGGSAAAVKPPATSSLKGGKSATSPGTPKTEAASKTEATPKTEAAPKSTALRSYTEPIYIDELYIAPEDATRALRWVNGADEAALRASGIYARGVNLILEKRPFASLEAFAATPYIGKKSVEAAIKASR